MTVSLSFGSSFASVIRSFGRDLEIFFSLTRFRLFLPPLPSQTELGNEIHQASCSRVRTIGGGGGGFDALQWQEHNCDNSRLGTPFSLKKPDNILLSTGYFTLSRRKEISRQPACHARIRKATRGWKFTVGNTTLSRSRRDFLNEYRNFQRIEYFINKKVSQRHRETSERTRRIPMCCSLVWHVLVSGRMT